MGKRGGASTARGAAAAGGGSADSVDMGTVTFNGKETDLTGKVVTKWQNGPRAEIEIEISAKGVLGGRAFGSVVMKTNAETKTASIVSINSIQALKGQGVGERMYASAFLAAKQRGITTFTSDNRVSLPAANAWRRIAKKIGGVKEGKSSNDGQQLIGSGKSPVFTLDLGKVSVSTLRKLQK